MASTQEHSSPANEVEMTDQTPASNNAIDPALTNPVEGDGDAGRSGGGEVRGRQPYDPTGHYATAYKKLTQSTKGKGSENELIEDRRLTHSDNRAASYGDEDEDLSDESFPTRRRGNNPSTPPPRRGYVPTRNNARQLSLVEDDYEDETYYPTRSNRFTAPRGRGYETLSTYGPQRHEYDSTQSYRAGPSNYNAHEDGVTVPERRAYGRSQAPSYSAGPSHAPRQESPLPADEGFRSRERHEDDEDEDEEDDGGIFVSDGMGGSRAISQSGRVTRPKRGGPLKDRVQKFSTSTLSDFKTNNAKAKGKRAASRSLSPQPGPPPFRNFARGLEESRYAGGRNIPWGTNNLPDTVPQGTVSDASLKKRGLDRGQGPRVCRRGYGANDPENIDIVNMKEHDGHSFGDIRNILNDRRIKEGRAPSLSTTGVANRYNRTAPLLFAAQGLEFVPLSQRKNRPMSSSIVWTPEDDLALVDSYKEFEQSRWQEVARIFHAKTGKEIDPTACAQRHTLL
ncbi:hypothetical protein G7Y89_g2205 [Cudoniella acicularis]|uniref:Myb-like domain-containing protein n=1 Tax=Cudoniella acicularis TaxID=354080 RepID=A0A8H4RVR2_9HELO|nr:hypothetical protein G7Y89_g2205 [Cudoniella acicularis]